MQKRKRREGIKTGDCNVESLKFAIQHCGHGSGCKDYVIFLSTSLFSNFNSILNESSNQVSGEFYYCSQSYCKKYTEVHRGKVFNKKRPTALF